MPIFTTKIRHSTFTLSPFTSEQMATIGQFWLVGKIQRIRRAEDSKDQPAKPLQEAYRRRKVQGSPKYGIPPAKGVRDWYRRGVLLGSLKVKAASENRVTIGPVTSYADNILTAQRRLVEMWSNSPTDLETVRLAVRQKYIENAPGLAQIMRVRGPLEEVA